LVNGDGKPTNFAGKNFLIYSNMFRALYTSPKLKRERKEGKRQKKKKGGQTERTNKIPINTYYK